MLNCTLSSLMHTCVDSKGKKKKKEHYTSFSEGKCGRREVAATARLFNAITTDVIMMLGNRLATLVHLKRKIITLLPS
jgi:hypothetical protein